MNNPIFKSVVIVSLGLVFVSSVCLIPAKMARADSISVDGRLWAFNFIVPVSETSLKINLADWANGSSGISPGSNIQIYSPQSSNAPDSDRVITINNASGYSGKLELVPGGSGDNVVRVIVQAYDFTDSNRTGTIVPTAEYVDAKNHTVTIQASANIPISVPVITTINIASTTANSTIGGTQQLTAETLDQFGNPIDTTLTWMSDDADVAKVDSTGLVTAVSVGTADITASSGSTTSNISVITVASSTEQLTSLQATSSDQTFGDSVSTTTTTTAATITATTSINTASSTTSTSTPITTASSTNEIASSTNPVQPPVVQASATDSTTASSTPPTSALPTTLATSTPTTITPPAPTPTPIMPATPSDSSTTASTTGQ
jgi:Bacterial Ig-like domain (group 2)